MNQPTLLQRLHEDHARLMRVLAVLEHQIEQFSDDGPDFVLLENLVDYVIQYPDTVHHPLEDQLFDYVVGKGVTAAEHRLILSNRDQHAELRAATRKLSVDVRNVLNGVVVPAQQLKEHVSAYLDLQRAHLLIEERQLFPLAKRLLTIDDWQTLEEELCTSQDPMFDQAADRFADLLRYIVDLDRASVG